MSRFVITVAFDLHEGALREFLPMIVENATRSRAAEPGCERFDVLVPKDTVNQLFLYEIYKDKAAFDEHLKTQHFLDFNSASARLVKAKKVVAYDLVNDTARPPVQR
jgi:(4S)-4-hydroxy-5-phosphonooxypentane-2,3-dione isomerase